MLIHMLRWAQESSSIPSPGPEKGTRTLSVINAPAHMGCHAANAAFSCAWSTLLVAGQGVSIVIGCTCLQLSYFDRPAGERLAGAGRITCNEQQIIG
jgi:hypothetical protein